MKRVVPYLLICISALLVFSPAVVAQSDPKGGADECTVILNETAKPDHWEIVVNLTNEKPLFGLVFPLLIRSEKGQLRYDSTSFAGSRVENFAVKIPHQDTSHTHAGEGLKINIGLIGSVGPDQVELQPGSGVIAKHYVTALTKGITTESIVVDSTFIRPANHLMGTMIDAKTNVKPKFKFQRGGKQK